MFSPSRAYHCASPTCTSNDTDTKSSLSCPHRLIAIHLNDLGSFPPVVWESDDFLDGRTARILFVSDNKASSLPHIIPRCTLPLCLHSH